MPISNAAERKIGIKNTRAFIDADYTEVELRRPQIETTPAGGVRKIDPLLVPPQRFRLVPMSGLVWDRSRTTPDEGLVADVTTILIGLPEANVQQDDYFPCETDKGGWFKVVHVSPIEGYRKEARLRWSSSEPKA